MDNLGLKYNWNDTSRNVDYEISFQIDSIEKGLEHNNSFNTFETNSNHIPLKLITGLLIATVPNAGRIQRSQNFIPTAHTLIETSNNNSSFLFNGEEFIMSGNVTNETFGQFEKRIDESTKLIRGDISAIQNKLDSFATRDDLTKFEDTITQAVKKSNSDIRNWILGGVIFLLISIMSYLLMNPKNAINIFKAIGGID